MAIKLKLEGFEEMLQKIEAAGGTADRACTSALSQSAQIMQSALTEELNNVTESSLASRMPQPKINAAGNIYSASVGFESEPYDPKNLSDYYKAIFLNYGTPNRTKHGKERARGFVSKAKRKARPQIKKAQKEALDKILARLKG